MATSYPPEGAKRAGLTYKVDMCISQDFGHFLCAKCDQKITLDQEEIEEIRENQPTPAQYTQDNDSASHGMDEAYRKRREKADQASSKMGDYLLSGWTMLSEHCDGSFIRLFGAFGSKAGGDRVSWLRATAGKGDQKSAEKW